MKSKKVQKMLIFCFLLAIMILLIQFMLKQVNYAAAQFYFPVTSGASNFYNYGTLRYGNLFGLSGMIPFDMGLGFYGIFNGFYGWNNLGLMWPFGGLYGGISPFGPYIWPYF
jgi:hypothetical protein